MRFEFHPEALAEYEAAALYYAERDPAVGLRFVAAVEDALDRILDSPTRWRVLDEDVRRCLLGSSLGRVAGLLPLCDFQARFLDPILALEADNCWALLSPFASTYVCAYVYDAPVVPADAVATLDLCLGRLLQASAFRRDAYRSGEFSGFDQPELVRTLMFVKSSARTWPLACSDCALRPPASASG